MPSQNDNRAKGVQMIEQQPKILQVGQYIAQMPQTTDSVQMPATQDIVQIPPTHDTLQMAAQMIEIQPLKRALGGNRYLELKEWNGSKRVDLRFWKDGTVPTKEGVSLHLDQWKTLCNMSDVIDDLLTRVIEKEPVDWRYHIKTKLTSPSRYLTYVFISESTLFPPVNGPTVPPREVWLYTLENGKN
jgi:hypothetical protein